MKGERIPSIEIEKKEKRSVVEMEKRKISEKEEKANGKEGEIEEKKNNSNYAFDFLLVCLLIKDKALRIFTFYLWEWGWEGVAVIVYSIPMFFLHIVSHET